MKAKEIVINSIGIIKTPWETAYNMPIQPSGAKGIKGIIELFPEYEKGLNLLNEFSHIILIYELHLVENPQLEVIPFMDTTPKGIFATRSPKRPNKIGMSTVEIEKIEGNFIYIKDVDMINETPLLDIKPFFEDFDNRFNTKRGWLENKADINIEDKKSDKRFI